MDNPLSFVSILNINFEELEITNHDYVYQTDE